MSTFKTCESVYKVYSMCCFQPDVTEHHYCVKEIKDLNPRLLMVAESTLFLNVQIYNKDITYCFKENFLNN